MKENKTQVRGELALIPLIFVNSFAVVLMLYSGSGISAISSVPYGFNQVIPMVSLGTWTYIFQGLLVALLFMLKKRIYFPYLLSFVVGFFFGIAVDLHQAWIEILPQGLAWRILYFCLSFRTYQRPGDRNGSCCFYNGKGDRLDRQLDGPVCCFCFLYGGFLLSQEQTQEKSIFGKNIKRPEHSTESETSVECSGLFISADFFSAFPESHSGCSFLNASSLL